MVFWKFSWRLRVRRSIPRRSSPVRPRCQPGRKSRSRRFPRATLPATIRASDRGQGQLQVRTPGRQFLQRPDLVSQVQAEVPQVVEQAFDGLLGGFPFFSPGTTAGDPRPSGGNISRRPYPPRARMQKAPDRRCRRATWETRVSMARVSSSSAGSGQRSDRNDCSTRRRRAE